MEPNYLQKQLDYLWNRVKGKTEDPNRGDFMSAFEQAQADLQAEAIRNLKTRFEKEKVYWENLLSSKDEALARLQLELQEASKKAQEYKNKILSLQESEGGWLEQSFAAIELQKKTLNSRIEHLEVELENARKDFLSMKFKLEEEAEDRRKSHGQWLEKENDWNRLREALETETNRLKDQMNQEKQAALEEAARMDRNLAELDRRRQEAEELQQSEIKGRDSLIAEKTAQIEKISEELTAAKRTLETDREEKRLASVERERRAVQDEEDRKRMVEQLLSREKKIKELQDSLENMIKEQEAHKEILRRREETIKAQEELLSRRREDWVESVKGQASQQLNLSGKVIDLLNKLEGKTPDPNMIPASVPGLPASLLAQSRAAGTVAPSGLWGRWVLLGGGEKALIAAVVAFVFLAVGGGIYFLGSEGRKAAQAQKYLMRGNELYTNGALDESIKLLEKGFKLDPENSIIKNSYTLVLGELASRHFQNGQYEDALTKTEILNRIIPEDPDVVKLYNDILQSMGRKNRSKPLSEAQRVPMGASDPIPENREPRPESKKSVREPSREKPDSSTSGEATVDNQEL